MAGQAGSLNELEHRNAELQGEVSQLNSTLGDIHTLAESTKESLKNELDEMTRVVQAKEESIVELNRKVDEKERMIAELNEDMIVLYARISEAASSRDSKDELEPKIKLEEADIKLEKAAEQDSKPVQEATAVKPEVIQG